MNLDAFLPLPDKVTFTAVIDGLCKDGRTDKAWDCFHDMSRKGIQPNVITYNALIFSLCELHESNREKEAITLISEMENRGHLPHVTTYNTLTCAFCKTRDMNMVGNVLEEMATSDLKPDEMTYSTVIDGLCKAGDLSRAHSLMNKMLHEGLTPDAVTYNCLIDAHCRIGKQARQGFLNAERDERAKGLVPRIVTYNIILCTLRHRHDLEKTFLLMDQMKKEGCAPSDATVQILDWLVGLGQMKKLWNFANDDSFIISRDA
ncbi:putative pentatricopeptide repeat-containing protein At1g09680 [Cryptomeria japonica]|uniref:putative pentatricopeptide repeat-containing protein At1g09680 n=1 Tax=Cryptomeria japonica TaxID=3369 RepID=UPI0027DA4AD0|nr:putative pentatricopeptide repeat-containing protein At1g09680 [Cryptomeria japonica]